MSTEIPFGLELKLTYATSQQVVGQNRIYFTADQVWTPTTALELLALVPDAWSGNLAAVTCDSVSQTGAFARIVDSDPWSNLMGGVYDTPLAGVIAQDPIPFASSATVRFLPVPSANKAKGYVRHIGLSESETTGNQVSSAARTAIGAAWSDFVGELVAGIDGSQPGAAHIVVNAFEGFTLSPVQPDGTIHKIPTPKVTADIAGVQAYLVQQAVGRCVSRAGIRA